ncbi:uncharacterized protein HQ_3262A [Haloquadratum walsbyi DSM 16790]|uniref:Uncharacterized protein n=2 Tax=Haloquadratum walsbyi TaxID=293091 RepID=Q18F99_HALWD|nr:uncharacterized protein HQ_3262A [Haloquadratum walsbyi DSM 16790]
MRLYLSIIDTVSMDERLKSFLREQFREAGREYARARDAYQSGRKSAETEDDTNEGTNGENSKQTVASEQEITDNSKPDISTPVSALPCNETGQARIVCRRDAEKRAVRIDTEAHPACFESGHPDCEGCVRDIRSGIVETW